nr:winged helix-turn-helix domain-containing protein [Sphingobacterium multivorum]
MEDEGIIVGRSLDMFISKLRKKLEFDPTIKITVIRGKGYKLEVSSDHTESLGGKVFKHTVSLLYIRRMWCLLRHERHS